MNDLTKLKQVENVAAFPLMFEIVDLTVEHVVDMSGNSEHLDTSSMELLPTHLQAGLDIW